METNESIITQQCRNFKKYLKKRFCIKNFGNFICASTFSLQKFEEALKEARDTNVEPKSFRIYYGCDEGGHNHELYIAFLDKEGNVIETLNLRKEPLKHDYRCPPGGSCQFDAFIGDLM